MDNQNWVRFSLLPGSFSSRFGSRLSVRDVTSSFYANYHAGEKWRRLFHRKKVKDVFSKPQEIVASKIVDTNEGYLCNDCHKSLSKQTLELVEITHLEPESAQCKRELPTETRNHDLSRRRSFSLPLLQDLCSRFLYRYTMPVLPLSVE